jgi:hypothetical protein
MMPTQLSRQMCSPIPHLRYVINCSRLLYATLDSDLDGSNSMQSFVLIYPCEWFSFSFQIWICIVQLQKYKFLGVAGFELGMHPFTDDFITLLLLGGKCYSPSLHA